MSKAAKIESLSLSDKVRLGFTTFVGTLVLGGAVKSPAAHQEELTPVEGCKRQISNYPPVGQRMAYINNVYVREKVWSLGVPACAGVAELEYSVRPYVGVRGRMRPNAPAVTVHEGADPFRAAVTQRTNRPLRCGQAFQQQVFLDVMPYNGEAPATFAFKSPIGRGCYL